ncbi:MAG: hypothetical protein WAV73_04900 [Candidatus Moraniibacteriota bacterium]
MTIRENQQKVVNLIRPANILVSVFDKTNLDVLVASILNMNPDAVFYSTGGTGKKIVEILNDKASKNYMSVEEFTGAPEMEGGLVKTLHPKVHAGLLAERGNPAHEKYLTEEMAKLGKGPGIYFDILAGNLYPFTSVTAKADCTAEMARVNIDIGGPTMIMAGAKNWPSVAVLTNPADYTDFGLFLKKFGDTTLKLRFQLAQAAFQLIGEYRMSTARYFFGNQMFQKSVLPTLNIAE